MQIDRPEAAEGSAERQIEAADFSEGGGGGTGFSGRDS